METNKRIASEILHTLAIDGAIRNISISDVGSPWDEKTRLRKSKDGYDIALHIWKSSHFLFARIYRLLLYVADALDPRFNYNINEIPNGTTEPRIRETHNHIWSIYVDSRIERLGFENFYSRQVRRNLFIDAQKNYPWSVSTFLFDRLWDRKEFTHPEIVDYATHLDKLLGKDDSIDLDAFELEINKSITDHSVRQHIDKISSHILREMADDILRFTTSHCRGTMIEPSYYGIYFSYDQEIFAEMLTTKNDALHLTLFDFNVNTSRSYIVTENSGDIGHIQNTIKGIYNNIALHSRLKAIKNPYSAPIEK
jgi:hypothetical protein